MVLIILCSLMDSAIYRSRKVFAKGKSVIKLSLGGDSVDQISGMVYTTLQVLFDFIEQLKPLKHVTSSESQLIVNNFVGDNT